MKIKSNKDLRETATSYFQKNGHIEADIAAEAEATYNSISRLNAQNVSRSLSRNKNCAMPAALQTSKALYKFSQKGKKISQISKIDELMKPATTELPYLQRSPSTESTSEER